MAADNKKVPWSQLEQYLDFHKNTIAAFVELKDRQIMKASEIELILPTSFL